MEIPESFLLDLQVGTRKRKSEFEPRPMNSGHQESQFPLK